MKVNIASECNGLGNFLDRVLGADKSLNSAIKGCELSIGPASDANYGVPAHAQDAIFVGDAAWIGQNQIDAATETLFQMNPDRVSVKPVYDSRTNQWNMQFTQLAGDALDPIAGQLFSPWNISYMAKVFKEPLTYSNVDKLVSYDSGNSPWAEIYTLFMEQYSGWAMAGQTGSLQNTLTSDVNVKDGMMSAPVINISGTYSLTLEETVRGSAGSPFGQSAMTRKQSYLNYAINMLKAYIAFYGNEETDTDGLMNINPIQVWPSAQSLKAIWDGSSTTKGSDAYRMIAGILNDFMTISDNKFDHIKIAMSPQAMNYLRSMPYSNVYDPTAAMKIFMKNYDVKDKAGGTPTIEFISEPFLKANSIYNASQADYMIMSCPEIEAGPTAERQPCVVFGAPLQKFVFPAIPGQYNTQYKTLARLAGVLAPVPAAVRVYQGVGVQ
jgi:hypothetical protein